MVPSADATREGRIARRRAAGSARTVVGLRTTAAPLRDPAAGNRRTGDDRPPKVKECTLGSDQVRYAYAH
jgi:hypothetical protein